MFHLYGIVVGIAVVCWWSMAEYLEPKLKKIILTILILALIGSRIYHVLEYLEYYQVNMQAILRVWEGGLSIWGALLLGGGYAILFARNMVWAIVTPLPLAQAIGRLANYVNGEFTNPVFGIPWWGMEAILDLVLFGVIWRIKREWRWVVYLLGYGLIRLALSSYR